MGVMIIGEVEYEVFSVSRHDSGSAEIEGRRYGMVAVQRRGHQGGNY
jgi:hypothetical protein